MDMDAVQTSYRRWAPVYDATFGAITNIGRRHATAFLNARGGAVLEVGVGTGLALPMYRPGLVVTGIDASDAMLARAEEKVERLALTQVHALRRMDARAMDFADATFDSVAAMHIMSVVPDPERVLAEMARVCKPGGHVVIVNHFARERGWLAAIERMSAPFADLLGWHSDFPMARVLGDARLKVEETRPLPPLGMMTLLVLRRL
ncbi:MAG: class I SAM-dependent methyltransferase [Pseudomonadota bacterium]|jgi:phosphatidylethanolamine/phosphatidyl-N-methylethanolamine N-methyltransferase